MLNGLLTLRGAWDRVRQDPVLKFMVVAVTAYGMATFEGPMLSIKSVNAISHYTDWTIAHVHVGALGWNGMLTFGVLYWLLPRMWKTNLYSTKLANTHFWIGTLGILIYAIPLYFAGFTQFLMWRDFTPDGLLKYPNFLETVTQLMPMYYLRAIGGTLFLVGVVVMIYNLYKTVAAGTFVANEEAEAPARELAAAHNEGAHWHRWIERRPIQMLIASFILVGIGGAIEMFPMAMIESNIPKIASVKPYTPLELQGRDLYIREGCLGCHSQMIRPFRFETERYGEYSKSGEFIYDRPFLWGSKRTGPDLQRQGGRNPDSWHYRHMINPQALNEASIMPPYPWLAKNELDISTTASKITALRKLGHPYPEDYEKFANEELMEQAKGIAQSIRNTEKDLQDPNLEKKEIIAMIAYLQRLGTDIKPKTAKQ
jgi:cytochrome c oxidase cbb3-type subunit I/II